MRNITAGLNVKLNKSDSLYHCIKKIVNLIKGENEPDDTFILHWDNVYETIDMSGRENILRSDQLVKVAGYQTLSKENQVQIDKMKEIFFFLRSDQNRYSLLLKQLRDGDNVGRD